MTGPWRYERVEDAGHWLQLDAPDTVNALLLDFLGQQADDRFILRYDRRRIARLAHGAVDIGNGIARRYR